MPKLPDPQKPTKPPRAKTKKFLKDKGHDKNKVDSLPWDTDHQVRASMCDLHGVTLQELDQARRAA